MREYKQDKRISRYRMMPYVIGIVALITVLVGVLLYTRRSRESFGMSPGTLVQLESTHVPTREDISEEDLQRKLVEKDVHDMTETGYGDNM
jgi:preprotein translocase subunit SecF